MLRLKARKRTLGPDLYIETRLRWSVRIVIQGDDNECYLAKQELATNGAISALAFGVI